VYVSPAADAPTFRTFLTWVLIVVTSLVLVLATVALGVQQVLLNTDRWVDVVGPLASDPRVQSSVADTAAILAVTALDLPGRVRSLPAPVQGLAVPAEAAIASFIDEQAMRLVQSAQFRNVWVDVNRRAHQGTIELLRGGKAADGAVRIADGQVQLSLVVLTPLLMQRLQQLAPDLLMSALPPDFGYVSIMRADDLAVMQRAVQSLDRLTLALIVLALLLVVATVLVSQQRRRAVLRLSVGVALGMVLAAGALLVAQGSVVGSLGDRPITGAIQVAMSAVLMSLAQFMLLVFVAAVVAAVLAYLSGRKPSAA